MTKASRLLVRSSKRKRLESREGTVTTSMALPRALHQEALMMSVRLNWTLAEIIRAALEEWLGRHHAEQKGGSR
jgi:hypothetical protein